MPEGYAERGRAVVMCGATSHALGAGPFTATAFTDTSRRLGEWMAGRGNGHKGSFAGSGPP